jgi:hypothetical protein
MGRYEGQLVVKWLPDGRRMELQDAFAFIDARDLRWDVPKDARIDGASIPQFLWTITGSPYTGLYRDASVVHDWYCSLRTHTCGATHGMFYEAMVVSGVSPARATLMYAAVKYAGPRWSDMDVHNANVATGGRWGAPQDYDGYGGGEGMGEGAPADFDGDGGGGYGGGGYDGGGFDWSGEPEPAAAWAPANTNAHEFAALAHEIESGGLSLDAIDARLGDDRDAVDLPEGLFRFDEQPEM